MGSESGSGWGKTAGREHRRHQAHEEVGRVKVPVTQLRFSAGAVDGSGRVKNQHGASPRTSPGKEGGGEAAWQGLVWWDPGSATWRASRNFTSPPAGASDWLNSVDSWCISGGGWSRVEKGTPGLSLGWWMERGGEEYPWIELGDRGQWQRITWRVRRCLWLERSEQRRWRGDEVRKVAGLIWREAGSRWSVGGVVLKYHQPSG